MSGLSRRKFGVQGLDPFCLQSCSFPFSLTLIFHLLPGTCCLLIGDGPAFAHELLLHLIPYRTSHLLLLFLSGFFELGGTLFVGLLLCRDRLLFVSEPVGLRLKLLLVLRAGCSNQRCGEGLGECDRFAAMRTRE